MVAAILSKGFGRRPRRTPPAGGVLTREPGTPVARDEAFARVPRQLRPWRRHLREGLSLAAAAPDWGAVDRYPRAERVNTRFALTRLERETIEAIMRRNGRPRWAVLTAALHAVAESDNHTLPDRVAVPVPEARQVLIARVPRALWPYRSELEQGLQLAESGGDWQAPETYLEAEFVPTRFVVAAATAERIRLMAARRGVAMKTVLTVALHALASSPAFVIQTAPDSAIARRWPRPKEGDEVELLVPGDRAARRRRKPG